MSEADIKAIADEMIRRYPENLSSISIEGHGFTLGATWGLERGTARFAEIRTTFHQMNKRLMDDIIAKNGRIEELESKLKLADRNNELLRGHRDQLEAMRETTKHDIRRQAITVLELTKGITPEQRANASNEFRTMEEFAGYILELTNEAKIKPDNDIIPEDYYIK